MFKGTVKFSARIKGNGLKFPPLDFNPNTPGVDNVEIEGPSGNEILGTVHFASVATEEDGKDIASIVLRAALDRISFFHSIAIENGRITASEFSPVNPLPGVIAVSAGSYALVGGEVRRRPVRCPIKTELE